MKPITDVDMLTLMMLSVQYPDGFAKPARYGRVRCFKMLNDPRAMRYFREDVKASRGLATVFPDTESALDHYFDAPGVVCGCGKKVADHKGGKT